MHYNDTQLLEELNNGNGQAFRQLFVTYYSPLCEFATQYVFDKDAEEIVQELMMHLWEKQGFLAIAGSIKSYLFMAVRNRCLNAIQRNKYKQVTHNYIYEKLKDTFQNPDSYMLEELSWHIEKAIGELPENYRKVFSMSRFEDYTNKEIAEQLGVSVKTVEYRITQTLKILRAKLKDYLYLLSIWL